MSEIMKILAYIPYDFFIKEKLNFNCEIKDGGAFIMRAVGARDDGSPLRPKEYIFFTNGMFSLAYIDLDDKDMAECFSHCVGYEVCFMKKGNFWEVTCTKRTYRRGESIYVPKLCVSKSKPIGKEVVILSAVEGKRSQYFYLQ